ncbi:MAG: hypothetical protein ABIG03_00670 [Candidatus Eisenbacteria bacterium]
MKRRIERAPLPDVATMRGLVAEQASELSDGAVVIDSDAQGSTGVDLLLVDQAGRPVFVDVVTGASDGILAGVFEHLAWIDENRRLFLRAYGRDGVSDDGPPSIVFVAEHFPRGVLQALPNLAGVDVRLVAAEYLIIDGEGELLLEEVASTSVDSGGSVRGRVHSPSASATAAVPVAAPASAAAPADTQAHTLPASAVPPAVAPAAPHSARLEDRIESESVQGLLKLFKSGVDGLDGRIAETELNGGVAFEFQGRRLAAVSVSPGSFTVTPGDHVGNPIVVSDRVSLERALNAVVSLFVREGQPGFDGGASSAEDALDEAERSELVGIWGTGLAGSEN